MTNGANTRRIARVGIIGAGQMGGGIAHVCALAGYEVFLNDLTPENIESRLATINGNLARRGRCRLCAERLAGRPDG